MIRREILSVMMFIFIKNMTISQLIKHLQSFKDKDREVEIHLQVKWGKNIDDLFLPVDVEFTMDDDLYLTAPLIELK